MALRSLKIPDEQRQLLYCIDLLHSDAQKSVALVQSLERQGAAHFAELASGHGHMAGLEEFVEVTQRQLVDAESTLLAVEGGHNEYRSRLAIEMRQHGGLETNLRDFCSHMVIDTS